MAKFDICRRGSLIALFLLLAVLASAAAAAAKHPPKTGEVWVADQGTNKIHILSKLGQARGTLDLTGQANKPHMVFFARDGRYLTFSHEIGHCRARAGTIAASMRPTRRPGCSAIFSS